MKIKNTFEQLGEYLNNNLSAFCSFVVHDDYIEIIYNEDFFIPESKHIAFAEAGIRAICKDIDIKFIEDNSKDDYGFRRHTHKIVSCKNKIPQEATNNDIFITYEMLVKKGAYCKKLDLFKELRPNGEWLSVLMTEGNQKIHNNARWLAIKFRWTGVTKEYYESGKLKFATPYVNGKKSGVVKWYDANGNLENETPYLEDKKNGVEKEYYENGKLKRTITYVSGKEQLNNDIFITYEMLVRKGAWAGCKKLDLFKELRPNGEWLSVLMTEGNQKIHNSSPWLARKFRWTGTAKVYRLNGELAGEIPFVEGSDGPAKWY